MKSTAATLAEMFMNMDALDNTNGIADDSKINGHIINQVIIKSDLEIYEIADITGFKMSQLEQIINGELKINLNTIVAICSICTSAKHIRDKIKDDKGF